MSDRSPSVLPRRGSKARAKRPSTPQEDEAGSPSLRPTLVYNSPSQLASAFERSPMETAAQAPELPPELELPPAVQQTQVSVPEAPPSRSTEGDRELLSDTSGVNADEEYSKDERLLNEFTKFHPMLRYTCTTHPLP